MLKILFLLIFISSTSCKTVSPAYKATLWMQSSAEFEASCIQSYNIATKNLLEKLKAKRVEGKKPAIILDLDETVLNNTPYQGYLINKGTKYPDGWDRWIKSSSAKAIPGSLNFLKLAHSQGVEIFYVSDRKKKYFEETFENLINLNIPVKKYNIMLREKKPGKESRRAIIRKKHEILLLLGDNLSDFDAVFDPKSSKPRHEGVKALSSKFGSEFIIFPNPMYGKWEYAIKNDKKNKSLFQGF